MPDVWRAKENGETWDVYCGDELCGIEFGSREAAEDFMREFLPEGWTTEWPTIEGWYWFWDPSFPELVEAAQVRIFGNGIIYTRSSEEIREIDYPGCQWHVMEKPPAAPDDAEAEVTETPRTATTGEGDGG